MPLQCGHRHAVHGRLHGLRAAACTTCASCSGLIRLLRDSPDPLSNQPGVVNVVIAQPLPHCHPGIHVGSATRLGGTIGKRQEPVSR